MKVVYIYALINPLNNKIFYVGASINPLLRVRDHYSDSAIPTPKSGLIKKIKDSGRKPKYVILKQTTVKYASKWEKFFYNKCKNEGCIMHQSEKFGYTNKYLKQ